MIAMGIMPCLACPGPLPPSQNPEANRGWSLGAQGDGRRAGGLRYSAE